MPAVNSNSPAEPHDPADAARSTAPRGTGPVRDDAVCQHSATRQPGASLGPADLDSAALDSAAVDRAGVDPAGVDPAEMDRAGVDPAGQHEQHRQEPERPAPAPSWSSSTITEAGDLLRALAAPVRIAIVLQLRHAESCVHDLVDALGVAQPLISQHLRVLKSAGVVRGERHGREVVYRLVDEHLAHIVVDAAAHAEEVAGARGDRSTGIAEPSSGRETETG